jgi:hypothetical protein
MRQLPHPPNVIKGSVILYSRSGQIAFKRLKIRDFDIPFQFPEYSHDGSWPVHRFDSQSKVDILAGLFSP